MLHRSIPLCAILSALVLFACSGQINSFSDCVSKGGLVLATDPPRCRIAKQTYPIGTEPSKPVEFSPAVGSLWGKLMTAGAIQGDTWDQASPAFGDAAVATLIHGELVVFYYYRDAERAQADATSLKSRGTLSDGSSVHTGPDVHYFYQKQVIGQYQGKNEQVLNTLKQAEKSSEE